MKRRESERGATVAGDTMSSDQSKAKTFDDVLVQIRNEATSSRDLGDLFEKVTLDFFQADRHYSNRFGSRVWPWKRWAHDNGIDRPDEGIDIVAEERNGDLCAIQCKCYADDGSIDLKALGTFMTAAGTYKMNNLILVYTGDHITEKAEFHLKKRNGAILTQEIMRDAAVDWSEFPKLKPRKPHRLRPYQQDALKRVAGGFGNDGRGQLLMACGTGKTLVSLRVAETVVPAGGTVLYLVPSITLIQQSMRAWSENRTVGQYYIGVCSDKTVSGEDGSITELECPVSTDPNDLKRYLGGRPKDRMTVVFCTYNSIQVVANALGRGRIDLALCDEAHRTIGGAGESYFTKVHEDANIRIKQRLYMTATPKIFTDKIRRAADAQERKIYAMDDERVYGPVFYELKFDEAVHKHEALSDYRVRIAFIDPSLMDPDLQASLTDEQGLLPLNEKNKMVAVWHSLLHPDRDEGAERLLQRVIVFSNTIRASKRFAGVTDGPSNGSSQDSFGGVVNMVKAVKPTDKDVKVRHVDGKTRALERKKQLRWLGESNRDPQKCRLLSNARCLSEGVDVPALDGVIFMEPRKSMVDVVQAVGRVMRRHPGKEYGYVILPVAVPAGEDINKTLDDGTTWKVVWEVLNALRSHDSTIAAEINKLVLDKKIGKDGSVGERIRIMSVTDNTLGSADNRFFAKFYPKLASKLVEKVGDIDYYDAYGKELGNAARSMEGQLRVMTGRRGPMREEMRKLHESMRVMINGSVTEDDTVQMLAHHMVLSRVFDALFQGEFKSHNPISAALERLTSKAMFGAELKGLEKFYADAKRELAGIKTREARQNFIKKVYGNFFKSAYKKGSEKHGIVYTPVEVIDFIIRSVDEVLRDQFGRGFGDKSVAVLDPFTGTGTFITRLLESGLIDESLYEKYRSGLHANELMLLAYYVASVNIETTFQSLTDSGKYVPFTGICYTDTLNTNPRYRKESRHRKVESKLDGSFKKAHERVKRQNESCLWVIMGNPPYSAGQSDYNNENPNLSYPDVDARIKDTYARKTKSANINSLYDSYIRAFRWASDRIDEAGIIAFVTNAGFLRSDAAAGVRAYTALFPFLHEEFTDVWCFDLRGNARTQGETRKRERGNVFGVGSRAPVAITILVRNPDKKEHEIHYRDIGDYLSAEQKLNIIAKSGLMADKKDWQIIESDKNHDWLDQRNDAFVEYIPIGNKETKSGKGDANTIFRMYSRGIETTRDTWMYNSSKRNLSKNMKRHINYCNTQNLNNPTIDPRQAKWTSELSDSLMKLNSKPVFEQNLIRATLYRPFLIQYLYFETKAFIHRPSKIPLLFPEALSENIVICIPHKFTGKFSTLITDITPDVQVIFNGQCFPLFTFEQSGNRTIQKENITDYALKEYRAHYSDDQISKTDIFYYVYGLLHHPGYRKKYANNLSRELPHVPMAPDFWAFSKAGKALADLHLGFFNEDEKDNRYPLGPPRRRFGRPAKLAFDRYRDPETSRQRTNYTRLKINGILAYDNIPEIDYRVNGRTPLEWLADRYRFTTDKESGITNDPCEKLTENDMISLVERAVHVGVKSDEIIGGLPEEFEPAEWTPKKTGLDVHMDLGGPTQSVL